MYPDASREFQGHDGKWLNNGVLDSGGLAWTLQCGCSAPEKKKKCSHHQSSGAPVEQLEQRCHSSSPVHLPQRLQRLTQLTACLHSQGRSCFFFPSLVFFLRGDALAQSLGNVRLHYPASRAEPTPPFVCKSLIVCRSFVRDNEAFCPPCVCHRSSLSRDSVRRPAIHHV